MQKQNVEPVLTFDQPLWLKCMMVKTKVDLSATILLGNFHAQMSFLVSIGYVMKNSGIKEVLSTVYVEKSVEKSVHKMLEGKQYERAMRAHDLLVTVLKQIMVKQIAENNNDLFQDIATLYHTYTTENNSRDLTTIDLTVSNIDEKFTEMSNVSLKPEVLEAFQKGLFVVRRTYTFWSAVSPDLCIEQSLMASLKGSSGLTRGRSLTKVSRLVWVLSHPGVLANDLKVREMTSVRFKSSEQHIDLKHTRLSRLNKNVQDINLMQEFCDQATYWKSVHSTDNRLKNIATGLVAPSTVSVTTVKQCGEKILSGMIGNSPLTFSFKKAMQAVQIPYACQIISKSLGVLIGSDLLFQRLVSVFSEEDIQQAFKFELTHYPAPLFTEYGFMRPSSKSDLGKLINDMYKFDDVVPNIEDGTWNKVIDGGMLLYKIPWSVGITFSSILDSYVTYLNRFGDKVDLIFDGYMNSNTKDHCHRHRSPIQSLHIDFTSDMKLDCHKDLFLSNPENKQNVINLLAIWLIAAGHNVIQHTDDADRIIVRRSLNLLTENNVFADDTDILVLLLAKMKTPFQFILYRKQEKANKLINITSMLECIPEQKLENILLSHTMSGCDTTSGLFGIGKTKLFKSSILEDDHQMASIFYEKESKEYYLNFMVSISSIH